MAEGRQSDRPGRSSSPAEATSSSRKCSAWVSSYISRMIQKLEKRGFLEHSARRLLVTDRVALEGLACGCNYSGAQRTFEDALSGVYPTEEERTAA